MSSEEMPLSVGLVRDGTPLSSSLEEMLSHMGIEYFPLDNNPDGAKYPIVIVTQKDKQQEAKKRVWDEDNVIVACEICDLKSVYLDLCGKSKHTNDAEDLTVNKEEQKLMHQIKHLFSKNDLPLVYKSLWPGSKNSCLVITHDVDWLSYRPLHRVVFQGGLGSAKSLSLIKSGIFSRKNFGWNIPEILELESKYNVKSTFFFRTRYDSNANLLPESVRLVVESGGEVGLHASSNSHVSRGSMKTQLEYLQKLSGKPILGARHHILKIKVPDTWKIEVEEGLSYDATFSYNRMFGFRAGCCYPYHPIAEDRLPIIELPTPFMDWTALHRRIRGRRFFEKLQEQWDVVNLYNGVMVVNFHNTYINHDTFVDVYNAYEALLSGLSRQNVWVAMASECAEWWKFREQAKFNPRLLRSDEVKVDTPSPTPVIEARRAFRLVAETHVEN